MQASNLPENFSERDYERQFTIECPACNGRYSDCEICDGTGQVTAEQAHEYQVEREEARQEFLTDYEEQ